MNADVVVAVVVIVSKLFKKMPAEICRHVQSKF